MEVSFVKPDAPIEVQSTVETVATPAPAPVAEAPVVDAAPAAAIPTAPATAVVPAPPAPLATASPVAFDDENIGFEDVILPRINIVQKVGDLSQVFNPGEIVLNQSQVIYEPAKFDAEGKLVKESSTGPLLITVLGFRKRQFTEKVEGGKLGLLLNNESEIGKHNGTLDYNEWQESLKQAKAGQGVAKKYFQRLATAVLLVEKPASVKDDEHVLFPYDFGDKWYALALWSMKGTGYTHAAKHLFTWRKIGHLRSGYNAAASSLTTKMEKFGDNWAAVPVVKAAAKNSDEFRAFCRTIVGA
jgi:hypothetical protein